MKPQMDINLIREKNRYAVLRHLVHNSHVLRSDLSQITGVSTMTIKKVVDDLLERGLVTETKAESDFGRKPQALNLASQYGLAVCFNLSSKSAVTVTIKDIRGNTIAHHIRPVDGSHKEGLDDCIQFALETISHSKMCCIGAGLAVPSVYNAQKDELNYDLIPSFQNWHPFSHMRQFFPRTNIRIMQDVRAAAIANSISLHTDSLFYLYLGEGVGGCHIQEGRILTGRFSMAGEIGQCLIEHNGSLCRLEDIISVSAFQKALKDTEDIVQTAARTVINLNWAFNPDTIVVGSSSPSYAAEVCAGAAGLFRKHYYSAIPNRINIVCEDSHSDSATEGVFGLLVENWLQEAVR